MTFMDVAGHASFALSACAWLMRDIVKLRVFALVSLMLGLLYNSTLETGPLWLVLFWLSIFFCINVTRVIGEIVDRLEVRLPAHLKVIAAQTFPLMHTRDFAKLASAAEIIECNQGDVLLNIGDATDHLCLLARGRTEEVRDDRADPIQRCTGVLWGELTFVIGADQFDASPCSIVVVSRHATVWRWRYDTLHRMLRGNDRMRAALSEAFVRSAGFKHGLLGTADGAGTGGTHETATATATTMGWNHD